LLEALTKTDSPHPLAVVADNILGPDDYCATAALHALTARGDKGIAQLIRIFPTANTQSQTDILHSLKEIDTPRSRSELKRLQPAVLQKAYAQLDSGKQDGLAILTNLHALAQPAFPRIAAALKDPNDQIRADAADALRDIELADAIPELRKLSNDPNAWVRQQVKIALLQLGYSTLLVTRDQTNNSSVPERTPHYPPAERSARVSCAAPKTSIESPRRVQRPFRGDPPCTSLAIVPRSSPV
jgi:hypothetical protein